jgi:hypothetical protein
MAKRTTINLPVVASAFGAAKGAGFDTDNIVDQAVNVVTADGDANLIVAQVMEEGGDVVRNFSKDPTGTSINVMVGALVPIGTAKVLGYALDMFGLPKSKAIGKKITLKWAL